MSTAATEVQRLAAVTAQGIVLDDWRYWIAFILLTFLASATGSYLAGYLRKRGETAALKADAEAIRAHLKHVTSDTEEIKSKVAQMDWLNRERLAIRRSKLEEALIALLDNEEWLDRLRNAILFEEQKPVPEEPIERFDMLITLYFPELAEVRSTVYQAHKATYISLMKTHKYLLGKTPQEKVLLLDAESNKVLDSLKIFIATKKAFELAAAKLMQNELIPKS